jgi:hypothetical protein
VLLGFCLHVRSSDPNILCTHQVQLIGPHVLRLALTLGASSSTAGSASNAGGELLSVSAPGGVGDLHIRPAGQNRQGKYYIPDKL